jgi:hypothetical protein
MVELTGRRVLYYPVVRPRSPVLSSPEPLDSVFVFVQDEGSRRVPLGRLGKNSTEGERGLDLTANLFPDDFQCCGDVICNHLALTFLDEETWSCLQIGWKRSSTPEIELPPADLVGWPRRDHPSFTTPFRDVIDRLDRDISHEQKDPNIRKQADLFFQNQGTLIDRPGFNSIPCLPALHC